VFHKYKIVVLLVIIAAVLAVLYLPGNEKAVEDVPVGDSLEVTSSPNEEPFRDFIEARQAGKPIFLEFYSRF